MMTPKIYRVNCPIFRAMLAMGQPMVIETNNISSNRFEYEYYGFKGIARFQQYLDNVCRSVIVYAETQKQYDEYKKLTQKDL